jgi:hypothetical protein
MTKLNQGEVTKIKCLDYCCTEKVTDELIKEILSDQDFFKYVRFKNAFLKDTNKNLIFCPNSECVSLIDKSQSLQCSTCETVACKKCDQQ